LSIFAGAGIPTCGKLRMMDPTALLILFGLVFAGIGLVVVSFALLPGILMLVVGLGIIGTTIWLRLRS
jgi:hypothetical protein